MKPLLTAPFSFIALLALLAASRGDAAFTICQWPDVIPAKAEFGEVFGFDVAADAGLLLAGAPFDEVGGVRAGSAFVFRIEAGSAVEVAELAQPDPAMNDQFGGVALRRVVRLLG